MILVEQKPPSRKSETKPRRKRRLAGLGGLSPQGGNSVVDPLAKMLREGALYYPEEDVLVVGSNDRNLECFPPDVLPLGEKIGRGVRKGCSKKRPGKKISHKDIQKKAQQYLDFLGIEGEAFTRKSPRDATWAINKNGHSYPIASTMHWHAIKTRKGLLRASVEWMIKGKDRVMVRGLKTTSLLTLDIDCHDKKTSATTIERHRELARKILGACADTMPEQALFFESSPRGYHVSMVLDRKVSAKRAAKMAREWKQAVEFAAEVGKRSPVTVESFPRLDASGLGYGCALPLGAGQRKIGLDDLAAIYHRRIDDVRDFLRTPKIKVSTVEMILEGLPKNKSLRKVDSWEDDVSPQGDTGQFYSADFVHEWMRLCEDGLGDDESWDGVRRLVAGCRYAGLSDEETKRFMRWYLGRDDHRASHCQTNRGRKELLSIVGCQLKHFRKGLSKAAKDGRPMCWRNGLKSEELRTMLYGILGIPVRSEEPRPKRVLMRDRYAA